MPHGDRHSMSLRDRVQEGPRGSDWLLYGAELSVSLAGLATGSSFAGRLAELRGRSVLLATGDQLTTALDLIELEGCSRRLILCPPDQPSEHLPLVVADAEADAIVSDRDCPEHGALGIDLRVLCSPQIKPTDVARSGHHQTEWILLTSGTTGAPKLVVHSLASLTAAIKPGKSLENPVVWSTFYDIRRYGGLQIFLRAVWRGASLVLSAGREPTGHFLTRLGAHGVTHVSGTTSHWRRVLWSPCANSISPRYVRMSGEIADQPVLDNLRALYPQATIAHAYASTEAGVGFEVDDGREGFPASLLGRRRSDVEMKIEGGSLRIRSAGTAVRYLGRQGSAIADEQGFVDTGDIIELRGERCYFAGRRGGIINVGGLKVHPEEVEAVINRHPDVRMSLVRPKRNPITGSVVVADVVLAGHRDCGDMRMSQVKREIIALCREGLAQYRIPFVISFVPNLAVAESGKLARQYA
jgi:acyl-coenzyme A synthetase/AMP-(fatty) acid ligase